MQNGLWRVQQAQGLTFHFVAAIITNTFRGVAKLGIALGSGPRDRGFKSRRSDQNKCPL